MGSVGTRSAWQIIVLARQKLGLMQTEMATAIGTSVRTLSRWEGGASGPADFHLHKVAALLHPHDPDLAREAAAAGGRSLEQLGIVRPPPPTPPPPPPRPAPVVVPPAIPARLLVDAVVCAVASALEAEAGAPVPLARARIAVAAAFLSARDLRLGVDEAAEAVARATAHAPAGATQGAERPPKPKGRRLR